MSVAELSIGDKVLAPNRPSLSPCRARQHIRQLTCRGIFIGINATEEKNSMGVYKQGRLSLEVIKDASLMRKH